ncbi:hypothetical protein JZ751_004441 [Albula glossodonta]|uniref:Uncharacterized protein n=1 Tax=Albula glossodonta TaxID=121402 RepID=A0A8T2MQN9_9TELE|nr:hypothetical protein JZ751_004441 [Albula glossodonta]
MRLKIPEKEDEGEESQDTCKGRVGVHGLADPAGEVTNNGSIMLFHEKACWGVSGPHVMRQLDYPYNRCLRLGHFGQSSVRITRT